MFMLLDEELGEEACRADNDEWRCIVGVLPEQLGEALKLVLG